jgi:hypothetical protein
MSARLHELLDDLATDARGYGDPDRAVATARRRVAVRRVAVPLVAAAAVAILAAVLTSPAVRDRFDGGPEIGTTPDAQYPDRVTGPEDAEPLGDRHLTEPAAFIYAPCVRTCDPYLVTRSGRQYRLPSAETGPPTNGYTLSPDGTWFGYPTPYGYRVRDLGSDEVRIVQDRGPGVTSAWVWSPDGSRLLLARHVDGNVDHYLLVNLVDGSQPVQIAPPAATVVAVRNNGDLVGWISGGEPNQIPVLGLIPRGQSTVAAELPLRLPPEASGDLMRDGERFQPDTLYLDPTGDSGVLVVNAAQPRNDTHWPAGVLGLELSAGGTVTGRTELPVSTGADAGDWHVWEVANNLAGGVVLLHWQQDRTEIVVLNDVNGDRVVVTVLPPHSQVTIRGDGRY